MTSIRFALLVSAVTVAVTNMPATAQQIQVPNVLSGARLARAYFPGMLERNWGRIIFISSESGLSRLPR